MKKRIFGVIIPHDFFLRHVPSIIIVHYHINMKQATKKPHTKITGFSAAFQSFFLQFSNTVNIHGSNNTLKTCVHECSIQKIDLLLFPPKPWLCYFSTNKTERHQKFAPLTSQNIKVKKKQGSKISPYLAEGKGIHKYFIFKTSLLIVRPTTDKRFQAWTSW